MGTDKIITLAIAKSDGTDSSIVYSTDLEFRSELGASMFASRIISSLPTHVNAVTRFETSILGEPEETEETEETGATGGTE